MIDPKQKTKRILGFKFARHLDDDGALPSESCGLGLSFASDPWEDVECASKDLHKTGHSSIHLGFPTDLLSGLAQTAQTAWWKVGLLWVPEWDSIERLVSFEL